MNKIKIIGVVVVLIAIVLLVKWLPKGRDEQQVSKLDVIDTVGNFYNDWLEALKNPGTADPSLATLTQSPLLSPALSARLGVAIQSAQEIDPVLCQAKAPEGITIRNIYLSEKKAEILVTSKDKEETKQAMVTLMPKDGGWYMDKIECSLGEFAPEKEFSFEKEGFLIKASVPKPYNNKNWHLVFEDNGKLGNVVPLFFDKDSQCTSLEGVKAVCKTDQFVETAKVSVRGQMTERGLSVKRLEFVR